ncbi:hypothetical protein Zmor_001170 [Zophobas morio]|uniref:Uncharacterized protein n=1 Tax=Zophobas morio TaxID=2755281 RepID=A0AA38J813_9CUCU|nr:hypothetical protein Zmor_001170 [Zophobas morio]
MGSSMYGDDDSSSVTATGRRSKWQWVLQKDPDRRISRRSMGLNRGHLREQLLFSQFSQDRVPSSWAGNILYIIAMQLVV